MRQDQKDYFSVGMKDMMEKVLLALFGQLGATKIEEIIPSADQMVLEAVDIAYAGIFTEAELDEMVAFHEKFKDKTKISEVRVQKFIEQYMTEHEEEMKEALSKL